jgi:hypothetical protein
MGSLPHVRRQGLLRMVVWLGSWVALLLFVFVFVGAVVARSAGPRGPSHPVPGDRRGADAGNSLTWS